jgi:hypothetical protein
MRHSEYSEPRKNKYFCGGRQIADFDLIIQQPVHNLDIYQ